MSQPILNSDGQLVATIQLESKFRVKEGQGTREQGLEVPAAKPTRSVKKKFVGFNHIDEQVLLLLAHAIRVKLDQLLALKRSSELENEVINTIKLAGSLTTQRSTSDLIKYLKISVPPYFGFEGASILLRDVKTGLLFSINEVEKQARKGKEDSEEATAGKDAENPTHLLRETAKVTFPTNSGVTGQVFNKHKIIYHNQVVKDSLYLNDIDNQTGITDVRNYLLGPVFPHSENAKGDRLPVSAFNRTKPIGILQLINKRGYLEIGDYDIRKFVAIQELIGQSIDKAAETHSTVNIRIGVQERISAMEGMVAKAEESLSLDFQ